MNLNSLYDVYVSQLKDMYSAEQQLTEALPKLVDAASTPALKDALQQHLQVTHTQWEQVRAILDELDENPTSTHCKAMEGLIKEGSDIAKEKGNPKARDAAILLAAQKVEHYEIATYGGLRAYANELGYEKHTATLTEILDQEYDADELLDEIAEGGLLAEGLNEQAER